MSKDLVDKRMQLASSRDRLPLLHGCCCCCCPASAAVTCGRSRSSTFLDDHQDSDSSLLCISFPLFPSVALSGHSVTSSSHRSSRDLSLPLFLSEKE